MGTRDRKVEEEGGNQGARGVEEWRREEGGVGGVEGGREEEGAGGGRSQDGGAASRWESEGAVLVGYSGGQPRGLLGKGVECDILGEVQLPGRTVEELGKTVVAEDSEVAVTSVVGGLGTEEPVEGGHVAKTRILLLSAAFAALPPSGLPLEIKAALDIPVQESHSDTVTGMGTGGVPGTTGAGAGGIPGTTGMGASGVPGYTGMGVSGVGGPRLESVPGSTLIRCRVVLSYEYWAAEEILRYSLPEHVPVPTSFEAVGHIAHLNLLDCHSPYRHFIAQVILEKHRPRIKSVVNKTSAIHSKYRTMTMELLAGSFNLVTTVHENGLALKVDFARVYWNSRLGTERRRLVSSFGPKDVVCDVFAGVGPIAVAAAKAGVKHVYANDLNPSALTYLAQNIIQNGVASRVQLFNSDGRDFLRHLITRDRPVPMTQIVMNLPADAIEFLDVLKQAFPREKWGTKQALPTIHVYGFSKAASPGDELRGRIGQALGEDVDNISFHRVRLVAPGKWMVCCSFKLPARIAFDVW